MKTSKFLNLIFIKLLILINILSIQSVKASTKKNSNNKLSFAFQNCLVNSDVMLFFSSTLYKKNMTTVFSKNPKKTENFDVVFSNKKVSDKDKKNYKLITHFVKPIFITVNHSNEINNINSQQLNKILTGDIKYWSDLSTKKIILPKLRIHLYAPQKEGFIVNKFFNALNDKTTKSFNQFVYFNDEDETIKISQFDPNSLALTTTANLKDKLKILPFKNAMPFIEKNKKQFINQNYKLLMHYYVYSNIKISKQKEKIINNFFANKKNIEALQKEYNFFATKK